MTQLKGGNMRTTHLVSLLAAVLAAILGIGFIAPVQAQALSDTFLLGAIWIDDNPTTERYLTAKNELHMNCVFDALKTSSLNAASGAEIYIMGLADPNGAPTYYNGISGLGCHTSAGRYWACSGIGKNPYDAIVWNYYGRGTDEPRVINNENVYVRSITGGTAYADTILKQLHAALCPFTGLKKIRLWARISITITCASLDNC
jgi:hypothetical protein